MAAAAPAIEDMVWKSGDLSCVGKVEVTTPMSSVTTMCPQSEDGEDDYGIIVDRVPTDLDFPNSTECGWHRQISPAATSGCLYDEAYQTLIFFDWDDTIFPTTELVGRQGIDIMEDPGFVPSPELEASLKVWRSAALDYLTTAASLSGHCVILTNSQRPWVANCVAKFLPEASHLIGDGPGQVSVVYADESLVTMRKGRRRSSATSTSGNALRLPDEGLRPARFLVADRAQSIRDQCMSAKRAAMEFEANRFYSQYPGQTWKNILSIGDMPYEHDALQDVTFRRNGPDRETLRTKAIIVPTEPTMAEISLRLKFSKLLLPAYVHFDGSIDVDLAESADPLSALSKALKFPELMASGFPRFAWGLAECPSEEDTERALESLASIVQDYVAKSIAEQEAASVRRRVLGA